LSCTNAAEFGDATVAGWRPFWRTRRYDQWWPMSDRGAITDQPRDYTSVCLAISIASSSSIPR
jgi:hypothetical protein